MVPDTGIGDEHKKGAHKFYQRRKQPGSVAGGSLSDLAGADHLLVLDRCGQCEGRGMGPETKVQCAHVRSPDFPRVAKVHHKTLGNDA